MLNELLLKGHVMALDLSEAPRGEQPACSCGGATRPTSEAVLIAADEKCSQGAPRAGRGRHRPARTSPAPERQQRPEHFPPALRASFES